MNTKNSKRGNPIYPEASGSGYSKRQKKQEDDDTHTPQVEYYYPGQDSHSKRGGGGRYSLREFRDPRLGHAQFLKDSFLNPLLVLPPELHCNFKARDTKRRSSQPKLFFSELFCPGADMLGAKVCTMLDGPGQRPYTVRGCKICGDQLLHPVNGFECGK